MKYRPNTMNYHVLVANFIILVTLRDAIQVIASGVVEVRIDEFRNELGRDMQSECCADPVYGSNRRSCELQCRTAFLVCVTPYSSSSDCGEGSHRSEILGGNSFEFSEVDSYADNIIKVGFNFTWPGSFSMIIEAYHHDEHNDADRTIVRIETGVQTIVPGNTWRTQTQDRQGRTLRFSYRVLCDKYNYGSGCSEFCKPRNDRFGHWGCNSKGDKVCLEGWESSPEKARDYCLKPKCLVGCDLIHGYCKEPNECRCRYGWEGDRCNKCVKEPRCRHGTCETSFECLCKQGWGGMFCNLDLNFCTHHKPCRNNARCRNSGLGSFTCKCLPGFTGKRCELFSGVCESNPCRNGGKCVATNTGFKCDCIGGYSGTLCDNPYCESNPCANGGSCISKPNGHECKCQSNFAGKFCEVRRNGCARRLCLHGGICEETSNYVGCKCSAGYTGTYCQQSRPSCTLLCEHGTCVVKNGAPQCDCKHGYSGRRCDLENHCDSDTCMNNGVCNWEFGKASCTCKDGFSGTRCEHSKRTGPNSQSTFIFYPNGSEGMSKTQTITVGLLSVLIVFLIIGLVICLIYPAKKRVGYIRGLVKNRMKTQTVTTHDTLPIESESSRPDSPYEQTDNDDDDDYTDGSMTIDVRPMKVKYRNVRPVEGRRIFVRPTLLPAETSQDHFTTCHNHPPPYQKACGEAKVKQLLV